MQKKSLFTHRLALIADCDTIQAVVLTHKLKNLEKYNKRSIIAMYYDENINNNKIEKLNYSKQSVYHQYNIGKNRIKLKKLLEKNNIQYGFHYPQSINQLDCFKKF